jgi:hypothetical protein
LIRKAESPSPLQREASRAIQPTPDSRPDAPAAFQPSQPTSDFPGDESQIQRAVVVDEVSSQVEPETTGGSEAENIESTIDTLAHRVFDVLRNKLRHERDRNRKF